MVQSVLWIRIRNFLDLIGISISDPIPDLSVLLYINICTTYALLYLKVVKIVVVCMYFIIKV